MSSSAYRCGWVAIMGPPNAGKSTLLNALLGQKVAIVTPKAQTTRNRITGILSGPDAQVIFMDTPGIHTTRGKMNRLMSQTAWEASKDADILMVMLDAELYLRRPEYMEKDIKPLLEAIRAETRPVLVLANKVDLIGDKSRLLPLMEQLHETWPLAELFPVSALNEVGLDGLLAKIKKDLPEGPAQFPEDQLSTVPVRFMAAESIREKLFINLHQELPYAIAVDIENWEEDPERNLTIINAAIYVMRPSQKAIVIGKGGANLKKIGQAARLEIADILGTKVHLELWVKVREDWTEDMGFLHSLALGAEPGSSLE
ncbi:GTPase Era [uncultured delta proteobacterium]|uniref:GTPase Era n=1 Tax=uncultured delta proteobacterium TaxID=34034 RepID=A0A212J5S5_9DELT|nr:GTPase Era [uncultured delta proteobacterium]